MTNEQAIEPMTEAEMAAFSTSLEEWAATRPLKEQVFLRQVLLLASRAEPEDVQGYWVGAFLSSLGQLVTAAAPTVALIPGSTGMIGSSVAGTGGQLLQGAGGFLSQMEAGAAQNSRLGG